MSTPLYGATSASGDSRLTRLAVAKAKDGDADGIHYLYVRYADDVRRYVATFVKDQYEAEDITHNVFAKLMTAITKYEERSVPFAAWILRVARNAALDHLRAKRMIPTEEVRLSDSQDTDDGRRDGVATSRSPWNRSPRTSARCSCSVTSSACRRWRSRARWKRPRARSMASITGGDARCKARSPSSARSR